VLVTRRDGRTVALLSDFGIARPVEGSAGTDLIGTPTYVAPELVAGRAPEPAVDVYALGVMAYELIAGRAPFVAPTTEALLRAHLDQPVARPPGVDDRVWQLLQECLAKVPAHRPAAADLALRWSELSGSATMDTPRPRPPKEDEEDRQPTAPAARPLRDRPVPVAPTARRSRRRLWILAAATALLGLAAGVVLAAVRSKPETPTETLAAGQYVVAAGLRLTDPTSVTVTWGGQAAALPGFAGYVVVDVSGVTARPISETLPGDATSYVVSGVRPGRESCFLVIAVGVRAPPPDPLPQPVCVTTNPVRSP
jgi:serine/threonine-protein kinase